MSRNNQFYILFDSDNSMSEGFVIVKRKRDDNIEYNYMDEHEKILSKIWFECCEPFSNGFAVVKLNGRYNYIKQDGTLLCPNQWFHFCYYFNKFGLAPVEIETQKPSTNIVKSDGSFLFSTNLTAVGRFDEDGYASIRNDEWKWNSIDKNGQIVFKNWYDFVRHEVNGLFEVEINGRSTFFDINEKRVCNAWFDYVTRYATNKNVIVAFIVDKTINLKTYNVITKEGKVLSPNKSFDEILPLNNGKYMVRNGNSLNYLNEDGTLMFKHWYPDSNALYNENQTIIPG